MKIVVFNGSPNGPQGNTDVLVQEFLAGAREAGAETEVVYLKDKEINHCIGCYSCWVKTPGVCIHQDDMPALLEKLKEADVLVCATPLYVYTVTGIMKDFMDRIIPIAEPFVEIRDGVCSHPLRQKGKDRRFVLISNCGFPEQRHFNGLKETFRTWLHGQNSLTGMVCCAGGPMLRVPEFKDAMQWYLDATRKAGREVVENGRISEETQAVVDRPLVPDVEAYAAGMNEHWRSLGVKPLE